MLWPTPFSMTTSPVIGGVDGARIELPVIPTSDRPVQEFELPVKTPYYQIIQVLTLVMYLDMQRLSIKRDEQNGDAIGIATNTTSYRYP